MSPHISVKSVSILYTVSDSLCFSAGLLSMFVPVREPVTDTNNTSSTIVQYL